jgi:hypothetical protein
MVGDRDYIVRKWIGAREDGRVKPWDEPGHDVGSRGRG